VAIAKRAQARKAPGAIGGPVSFLPEALRAWRALRPTKRAILIARDGSVTIEEHQNFLFRRQRFESLKAAGDAVQVGALNLQPMRNP
jgi:hypothetical protein